MWEALLSFKLNGLADSNADPKLCEHMSMEVNAKHPSALNFHAYTPYYTPVNCGHHLIQIKEDLLNLGQVASASKAGVKVSC